MQLTKMSITRALTTLKNEKAEIEGFFKTDRVFSGVAMGASGKNTNVVNMDRTQLAAHIQSEHDRIQGLMRRQVAIKNAINVSNQNTMVTINNKLITVAEAILLKGTIEHKAKLLTKYRTSATTTAKEMSAVQAAIDKRVDSIVAASINESTSPEDKVSISTQLRASQDDALAPTMVDPLDINDLIKKAEEEILFLHNELDYTLSESNTSTVIDVQM